MEYKCFYNLMAHIYFHKNSWNRQKKLQKKVYSTPNY